MISLFIILRIILCAYTIGARSFDYIVKHETYAE